MINANKTQLEIAVGKLKNVAKGGLISEKISL
jgi:hypothetical protein